MSTNGAIHLLIPLLACGGASLAAAPPAQVEEDPGPLAVLTSGQGRLEALPGHPVLQSAAGEIFAGGFRQRLTLALRGDPATTITVRSLVLVIEDFEPGRRDDLAYKIKADKLNISGTASPHEFRLSLWGDHAGRAVWIEEAPAKVRRSTSDNLLDTRPPFLFRLTPGSDEVEDLVGTVLAQEPGLYKVRFRVLYSCGDQDFEALTEPVNVYFDDGPPGHAFR